MSPPWMPLYVGDFIADTAQLDDAETGAYLLLIMHYWQHGGLPDDDKKLARIARSTPRRWAAMRPTIQAFFHDGWKHKRIEFELTEAARISAAGRKGGIASGEARRTKAQRLANDQPTTHERPLNDQGNDQGNDQPTNREALPSPSQRKKDAANAARPANGESASDAETDLYRRGREVLGNNSGGLVKKLIAAKGSIPLARAAIEQASTKANAREYIAGACRERAEQPGLYDVDPRL